MSRFSLLILLPVERRYLYIQSKVMCPLDADEICLCIFMLTNQRTNRSTKLYLKNLKLQAFINRYPAPTLIFTPTATSIPISTITPSPTPVITSKPNKDYEQELKKFEEKIRQQEKALSQQKKEVRELKKEVQRQRGLIERILEFIRKIIRSLRLNRASS